MKIKISVLVLFCCIQVHAQNSRSLGKVTKIGDYGLALNIGQQPSVMGGSRVSLKLLAHIVRRYPKYYYYSVIWTVRLEPKVLTYVESSYDRSHRNVSRESRNHTSDLHAKSFEDFGLDGVNDRDLQVVARKGGSFSDLEERVIKRMNSRR